LNLNSMLLLQQSATLRNLLSIFFSMIRQPSRTTLFPYTTLFRSSNENEDELIKTDFGRPAQLFACAIYGASRLVHLRKPVRPATTRSGRGADPARAAATCRSDRLVPRRTRCADSRRLHLSNRDCRGGPLDAKSFEPQG